MLASLTAVFKSSSEILSKYTLVEELNEYTVSWSQRFFALPILALAILIFGIPSLSSNFWMAISFDVPAGVAATVLYMKAIKASDISLMSPLAAISPALVLVSSPFIVQEFPSVLGLIGVMVTTVGLYILKLNKIDRDWSAPIRSLFHEDGSKFMVGMLLIYAISAPVGKLGVEASSPVMYSTALHIGQILFLTPLMIFKSRKWKNEVRNNGKALAGIGLLSGAASVIQMAAYTYTLVVYVIAIKRSGILISTLVGGKIFDEEHVKQRLIGATIILLGLILVALTQA
ncbi:MAG: EamA family transporter [Candidatus Nanohaloarchaea archaeon]